MYSQIDLELQFLYTTYKVTRASINSSLLNQLDQIIMELYLLSLELIGNTLLGLKYHSASSLKIKLILKPDTIK